MNIREATLEDAEKCGRICFEAFNAISNEHNFPADFKSPEEGIGLLTHVISRSDIYSVVAEKDGNILGSNVLWKNCSVAGIGPITVTSTFQEKNIGKALMEHVLQHSEVQGFSSVRLVQAAFNNLSLALYIKLGFKVQEPLSVMQGPAINLSSTDCNVRLAEEKDLEACAALCEEVHGFNRTNDLAGAVSQQTATVVERDGHISGYATMVGFFGHCVGKTNSDLKALIGAAESFAGPGILIPTRNAELMAWCFTHGLKIVQPMSLMSYGSYQTPNGGFIPSIIF
jgi:ribosomal protein S18 acetylase RimI-like enzyme